MMIGLADTILLSFDNRQTWINISGFVKYDSITITSRAFNDDYRNAQNEATFSLLYDPTVFALLRAAVTDVYVFITSESLGPTLGSITLGETTLSSTTPLFTGHFLPSYSRTYNGILDNTIIQIRATDSADLFDVPTGDIVYRTQVGMPYRICNPAQPQYSILHQLTAIVDPLIQIDPNLNIPIDIGIFAPPTTESSVKECIDTLLHEYGYTWRMDEFDRVTATKWYKEITDPLSHVFTDSDTTYDLTEEVTAREHEGVEITYYEVTQGVTTTGNNELMIYRDSNIPYDNDNGGFFGYPIPSNATYPLETNVEDETDPPNKVKVYQQYSNDGIQYFTNRAVTGDRQGFNVAAFSSDFSSIVATFDHRIEWRADAGISLILQEFGNKQARVIFENTTVDNNKKLYFFNIWAKLFYKTSARKSRAGNPLATDRRVFKYDMKFCNTKGYADLYSRHRAELFSNARSVYTFSDDVIRPVGAFVGIELDDGTNDRAMIMSRQLDNRSGQYRYMLKKHSTALAPLQSQSGQALSGSVGGGSFARPYQGYYIGARTTVPGV
jgi:hypothetical protein